MSAARAHSRDELREWRKRTGIRVDIQIPRQLDKLLKDEQGKYGTTKTQIIVAALTKYFGAELPEVRELAKLGLQLLRRQAGEAK